jgi:hypothetical protein
LLKEKRGIRREEFGSHSGLGKNSAWAQTVPIDRNHS